MGRRRGGVAQGLLGLALLLLEPPLADGARRKKGRPPAPMGDNEAGAASDRLERARRATYADPQGAMRTLAAMEQEGLLGSGETLMAIGACLGVLGQHDHAIEYFQRCDAMLAESPAVKQKGAAYLDKRPYGLPDLNAWGMALDERGRLAEALGVYGRALAAAPTLHELNNNMGNVLRKLRRPAEALGYYDAAVAASPEQKLYAYNRGMSLRDLGDARRTEAVEMMSHALTLAPDFFQASHELGGLIRNEPGASEPRLQEALLHARAALKLAPTRAEYHYAVGETHADLGGAAGSKEGQDAAYRRAEDSYWSALTTDGDHADAYFSLLWFALYRAEWRHLPPLIAELRRFMEAELAVSGSGRSPSIRPLQSFLLLDGPTQKRTMEVFAHEVVDRSGAPALPPPPPPGLLSALRGVAGARRIRLGYVSSDFGNHPLGRDFQHFFGFHDAEAFEVFAINIRRAADSTHWRSRIVEQVEHWVDVGSVGDEEAAATIRGLGLDVVFNLNGYTPGSRNRIFALRPAPIAVMWKGWAGTIGAEYVPWLVTDRVSSPPELAAAQYTERLLYTPYSYFLNDYAQIHDRLLDTVLEDEIGGPYESPADVDLALPAEGRGVPRTKRTFLFCNFNQHFKLDPAAFAVWVGALRRTPRSKLWMLRFPTDGGAAHLASEAAAAGLAPARLVSTALLPQDTHLSGKASAHLYLDTFVYNGHTTAADALWAGVPMLTLPTAKQIGRTAAGFAVALGCNEMVAASMKEFEDEAARLASSFRRPPKAPPPPAPTARERAERGGMGWDALRKRLVRARRTAPLFRTKDFARDMEEVIRALLRTELRGAGVADAPQGGKPKKKKKKKKKKAK